jgi:outer membrane protein
MKHIVKLALLALLFILPAGLSAQTKLGHINTAALRDMMPEVITANKKLDTIANQYQKQLDELIKDYQSKLEVYQRDFASKPASDPIRMSKETELVQFEERIKTFREAANNDINTKTQELVEPINKKINDAIKAVALEGKYTYIMEAGSGMLLYAADNEDITPLVKKKLGLK